MSPEDSALVAKDSDLIGLSIVLDETSVLALMQHRLPNAQISTVKKVYIRYKPSTNCIVKYQVSSALGEQQWYVKAFSLGEKERFERIEHNQYSPYDVLVVKEYRLVFYSFPYDARLKVLKRIIDPESLQRLLERVLYPGSISHPQIKNLDVLQYKPERRLVVKVELNSGERLVLKAYTEQRFQLANLARRRKLHSKHLLDVVGRSNKHRLLIHRWIEGDNLTYWYHGGERAVRRFYGCGQYIASFHRDSKPKRVSVKETGEFSRTLLKSSQGVAYLAPKLASRMETLCSELNTALKDLSSPKTVIHGDFYAKQVLINQEAVRLIDFDDVCYWFPAYDLGLFIAHLERDELSGTLSTPALHAFRTAFIKGYGEELDYSANELELFTSVGLLELAHHPFRNGYPDWLTSISQLVERAEQHFQAYKWLTQLENFSNKLPLSSELCDPYYAEPLLRKVLPTLSSIERLSNIELVRYKPGKRALLDYSFQRADGARLDILGKVRFKGFDKRAWNVNSALYKANFGPSNGDGIQVPEPLAYSKCHHIWFQRKVVGQPCFALFCQSTNGEIPQRIAQALFKLHSSNIEIDRVHTRENEVELLGVYLTQAMTLVPNSADKIKDIIHCCSSLSTQWSIESPKVTIHRDFYHDQILINEPQIFLLDLDLFCLGDAALDVGNFVAHIEEQCLRTYGQSEYAYKQVNQFVNSYLEFAGVDLRRTIEIYSLLSWARHIFISQRIPARREWTEQIIHECERRILRLNEQKW